MNELTEKQLEAIQETHDAVVRIETVLLGANGDKGLVGRFEALEERHNYLEEKHNRLSLRVYILIGALVGSGVLVGGITGFLR